MEFYGKVFGWRFQKFAGPMEYWSILTSSSGSTASGSPAEYGIDGGLLKRRDPAQPCVNTEVGAHARDAKRYGDSFSEKFIQCDRIEWVGAI